MACEHKKLELRGYTKPDGLGENDIWITDLSLICLDCGAHLMSSPEDLSRIVNISHPAEDKCEHPFNVRAYSINGFGRWRCLQCGKEGISSPTTKLHVKKVSVGIGEIGNEQFGLMIE